MITIAAIDKVLEADLTVFLTPVTTDGSELETKAVDYVIDDRLLKCEGVWDFKRQFTLKGIKWNIFSEDVPFEAEGFIVGYGPTTIPKDRTYHYTVKLDFSSFTMNRIIMDPYRRKA